MACKRWGFDFRNGYPIGGNSQYIWERVSFNDFIPEMYTLSRAAHLRELPILETTGDDILIDARAAKENELSSSNIVINSFTSDIDDDSAGEDETSATYIFNVPIDGQHSRLVAAAATAAAAAAAAACRQLRNKRRQPKITGKNNNNKSLIS